MKLNIFHRLLFRLCGWSYAWYAVRLSTGNWQVQAREYLPCERIACGPYHRRRRAELIAEYASEKRL